MATNRNKPADETPAAEPETAPAAEPSALDRAEHMLPVVEMPRLGFDGMPLPADAPETKLFTDPESGAIVSVPADYEPAPTEEDKA